MIWQGIDEAAVQDGEESAGRVDLDVAAARTGPQGMKLITANLFRVAALVLLLILLFRTEWLSFLLAPLTNNNAPAVYTQNSLPSLAAGHLNWCSSRSSAAPCWPLSAASS
jgi:hypothetical protein